MSGRADRDDPRLSIVIPSRRRVDLLSRCLETVHRHAPPGTQIIVVDDASNNCCVSAVAGRFAGVEAIRLPRPGGFCVAVNRGIHEARAPIVQLLNDDTEVEAGWAEAALRCFDDPNVVAAAPLVLRFPVGSDGPRIDSAGDAYHLGGFAQKRRSGLRPDASPLRPEQVFGASASSALYRREALLRVGGFPESFGAYFEDVDVAFRLRRAGGGIVFVPESRVWHHVHGSYGRPDRKMLEQQSRNEERVFWRNMPARLMTRALPVHVAVLAAKAWRRWQERTLLPFLLGRIRAFLELPALLKHRASMAELASVAHSLPIDDDWRPASRCPL